MTSKVPASRRSFTGAVIFCSLALFTGFWCFFSARWFVNIYGRIGFDSILYTLNASLEGLETELLNQYLLKALLPSLLTTCLAVFAVLFSEKKIRQI